MSFANKLNVFFNRNFVYKNLFYLLLKALRSFMKDE